MVKIFYIIVMSAISCLFYNCNSTFKKIEPSDKSFDVSEFKVDNYNQRVSNFLNSEIPIKKSEYSAVFVHTEGCSACINNTYSDLSQFISKTNKETYIFLNDSSLIRKNLNSSLRYICLPTERYDEYNILHSKIYFYNILEGNIENAIIVNSNFIDSVNTHN